MALEKLSRDDLIKFVKKQTITLQKCRAECEELKKAAVGGTVTPSNAGDDDSGSAANDSIQSQNAQQLEEWEREREELQAAYSQSQQSLEQSASRMKELEEQVTLLTNARDSALSQLKDSNKASKCSDCESLKQKMLSLLKEHKLLKSNLEKINTDHEGQLNQLKQDLETLTQERDQFKLDLESVALERNQLKSDLAATVFESVQKKEEFAVELDQLKQLKSSLSKQDSELNSVRLQLSVAQSETEKLKEELENSGVERKRLESEIEKLSGDDCKAKVVVDDFREQIKQLKAELEGVSTEKLNVQNDLQQALKEQNDLKKQLEDRLTELEELRSNIQTHESEKIILEDKLKELNERIDNAQDSNAESLSVSVEEMEKLKSDLNSVEEEKVKLMQQLEDLFGKHQEEVSQLNQEHSKIVTSLCDDHEQALATLKNDFAKKVEMLTNGNIHEIDTIKAEQTQTLAKINAEHAHAIEELKLEHANAMETIKIENDQTIEALKDEYLQRTAAEQADKLSQTMETLKEEHAQTLAIQSEEHAQALAKLKEEHVQEMETLKNELELKNTSLVGDEHAQAISQLKEEHIQAIIELKEEHVQAMLELRKEHSQNITTFNDGYTEKVSSLEEENTKVVTTMKKKHEEEIAALMNKHTEDMAALQENQQCATTKLQDEYEELKHNYDRKNEELSNLLIKTQEDSKSWEEEQNQMKEKNAELELKKLQKNEKAAEIGVNMDSGSAWEHDDVMGDDDDKVINEQLKLELKSLKNELSIVIDERDNLLCQVSELRENNSNARKDDSAKTQHNIFSISENDEVLNESAEVENSERAEIKPDFVILNSKSQDECQSDSTTDIKHQGDDSRNERDEIRSSSIFELDASVSTGSSMSGFDGKEGTIATECFDVNSATAGNISAEGTSQYTESSAEEVTKLREKLAEWEAMMQMLQSSKDDNERDLRSATKREEKILSKLSSLLSVLETAVKDTDLFPTARSELEEVDGASVNKSEAKLWSRLDLLSTIADQLCFERDEWLEKMQLLTEQKMELERKLSELKESENAENLASKNGGIGEADAELIKTKEDLSKMEAELVKTKTGFSDLQEIVHKMSDKLMEREEAYSSSMVERDRVTSELNKLRPLYENLLVEYEELKSKVSSEQGEKESSQIGESVSTVLENSAEPSNNIRNLLSTAEDHNFELNALVKNLEKQLSESEELRKVAELKNQELSERCTIESLKSLSLEERVTGLVENLVSRSGEVDNLSMTKDLLERELESAHGELSLASERAKKSEQELMELRGRIDEYKSLLSENERVINQLDALSANDQLTGSQSQINQLNEAVELKNEELKSLNKVLELKQEEISELESAKLSAESGLESRNSELVKLQEELSEKLQELNIRDVKLESLNETIGKLTKELDDTQKQLEETRELFGKIEKQLQETREQLGKVENENESLQEEIRRKAEESMSSSIISIDGIGSPLGKTSAAEATVDAAAQILILQKQLKEREERETKLKQLTLKAKKEATELKNKLEACQKELASKSQKLDTNFNIHYQTLQTDYDKLEAAHDMLKSEKSSLDAIFNQTAEEVVKVKSSLAETLILQSKLEAAVARFELEKKDLEKMKSEKEQEISAERIQRQQIVREKAELEQQIKQLEDKHQKECQQLQKQLKDLQEKFDLAKRASSQNSMLDLEIAEYDRTVKGLSETLREKDQLVAELQGDLHRKQEQVTTLQKLLDASTNQVTQSEEHAAKLKQLLIKAKKDLSESKKLEGEQFTTSAQMKGQLEMLTQLTEEQKLEISRLAGTERKLLQTLDDERNCHQRAIRAVEQKQEVLEKDLSAARQECSAVSQEYDSYKVRVHSVLKQQKNRANEEQTLEQERTERRKLEAISEQLKLKVQQLNQQLLAVTTEHEQLQEEQERLEARHTKLISDMHDNERMWKEKLEKASSENIILNNKRAESIEQLTSQSETLTRTFRNQLQTLQEEHQTKIDWYQQQLDDAVLELDRHRAQQGTSPPGTSAAPGSSTPVVQEIRMQGVDHQMVGSVAVDRVVEYIKDLRVEERESGEGSENVDDVGAIKLGHHSTVPSSFIPLEQLLSSSHNDGDTASVRTLESTADDLALRASLTAAEKQLEHVTELLNESEATVLNLTEQAKILKEEIRRLERNEQRETSISNMEYLKNVTYKFLTLKAGQERVQLIPVLTTMLKFSSDEKNVLTALANGQDIHGTGDGGAAGWGSYLHKFSGGLV